MLRTPNSFTEENGSGKEEYTLITGEEQEDELESYRRTTLLLDEDHLTLPVETVPTDAHIHRSHIHNQQPPLLLFSKYGLGFWGFRFSLRLNIYIYIYEKTLVLRQKAQPQHGQ